jgi:hypothetical protein
MASRHPVPRTTRVIVNDPVVRQPGLTACFGNEIAESVVDEFVVDSPLLDERQDAPTSVGGPGQSNSV